MTWDIVVDTVNVVTMVCAVIGVVLAAVLGWVAIHVAKSGNDTARMESLYGQVDDVLSAALELTSASASGDLLGQQEGDRMTGERELRRASERFDSRLRLLNALELLPESKSVVALAQLFAGALENFALADWGLRREGRGVLSDTILAGVEDDHTEALLERLTARYCTVGMTLNSPKDDRFFTEGVLVVDDRLVPNSFSQDRDVAGQLRAKLNQSDWEPRASTSLRLLIPWAQAKLGLVSVGRSDGEPAVLWSTRPEPRAVVGPNGDFGGEDMSPWEEERLSSWLDEWSPEPVDEDINGQYDVRFTPEAMSGMLLRDLRAAFLDQIVELAEALRAAVGDQHIAEVGWMRRKLGLV